MTGLTGLEAMDGRRMDWCLISAFVERWHPETSSFHFAWGEMTVTLHDVVQIMQMRVDGRAYRSPYERLSDMYQTIAPILGMDPAVAFNVGKCKNSFFFLKIVRFSINTRDLLNMGLNDSWRLCDQGSITGAGEGITEGGAEVTLN